MHIQMGKKTPKNLYFMDNQIMNIASIFIIYRFCICKFAYLVKFICNPTKSILMVLLVVIPVYTQSGKKFESPNMYVPS